MPAIFGLIAAALLVVPMFAYVRAHPEAETRLEMLDGPLQNIASGEFAPVIENAREALLAFIWPGFGDSFLAYNIPGRPIFGPLTAVFFLIGIVVCANSRVVFKTCRRTSTLPPPVAVHRDVSTFEFSSGMNPVSPTTESREIAARSRCSESAGAARRCQNTRRRSLHIMVESWILRSGLV